MRRDVWLALLLAAGTLLLYGRVFNYEFVNYDDPDYVTGNEHVQNGLTKEGIKWAFTKLHGEQTYWHPVTWLSHMLDVQLFGLRAGWHHIGNVMFHVTNVVLLFLLLRMMTGA